MVPSYSGRETVSAVDISRRTTWFCGTARARAYASPICTDASLLLLMTTRTFSPDWAEARAGPASATQSKMSAAAERLRTSVPQLDQNTLRLHRSHKNSELSVAKISPARLDQRPSGNDKYPYFGRLLSWERENGAKSCVLVTF